mmetsp:Transcript_4749/g.10777  ORF Transcript_4749/g.10777 Transcript_4749/m.10777 type:complete len:214 (-) Transcript_4749:1377-2018(-)
MAMGKYVRLVNDIQTYPAAFFPNPIHGCNNTFYSTLPKQLATDSINCHKTRSILSKRNRGKSSKMRRMVMIKFILIKQAFLPTTSVLMITSITRVEIMQRSLLPPTKNRWHTRFLLIFGGRRSRCSGSPSSSPPNDMVTTSCCLSATKHIIITAGFLASATSSATVTAATIRTHIKIQCRKSSQLHLPNLITPIGIQMSYCVIFTLEQHRLSP